MDDTNVTPDAAGIVERLNRLETFLKGEGALDNCWFGDTRPAGRGPFWWRSEVSAVANSVRLLFADKDTTIAAQAAELQRLREALQRGVEAVDTGRNEPLMIWRDHAHNLTGATS